MKALVDRAGRKDELIELINYGGLRETSDSLLRLALLLLAIAC